MARAIHAAMLARSTGKRGLTFVFWSISLHASSSLVRLAMVVGPDRKPATALRCLVMCGSAHSLQSSHGLHEMNPSCESCNRAVLPALSANGTGREAFDPVAPGTSCVRPQGEAIRRFSCPKS